MRRKYLQEYQILCNVKVLTPNESSPVIEVFDA